MAKAPSLSGRIALALVLMVGFYVLALGIAAALLSLPILEWVSLHRVHPKLALACLAGAGLIVWSVLPRVDRFPPPGVLVQRQTQPELFATVDAIAEAAGQALPREVYVVPDVNAFVSQRGGVMGFGSRRVLGIGLPLLRVMTVDQVRAVLAHEFGHFHGGDTKLGPWIHKTRAAIGRTIASLEGAQSLVSLPFRWYGNVFLRITEAVSRAQEYAADRLAAALVGARPLTSGLELLPAAAVLYEAYLQQEFRPILSAGRRPPLSAGFKLFLRAPNMRAVADKITAEALSRRHADPYDSHPPIRARVEALVGAPDYVDDRRDKRPALLLLRDVDTLEQEIVTCMTGRRKLGKLPAVAWSDVGPLQIEIWGQRLQEWSSLPSRPLADITIGELAARAARTAAIGAACGAERATPEDQRAVGDFVLGMALACRLHEHGFAVHAQPGDPVVCERDGERIEVLTVMQRLRDEPEFADTFTARVHAAGIADVRLDGPRVPDEA